MIKGATELELEIIDVAFPNNFGVAKESGRVVFVPGAVPGDRVRVRIRREEKRLAYGELVAIEEASPFRAEPACRHAEACGGCTLQQLAYEKQLELKHAHVVETLRRVGGLDVAEIEIHPITPSVERYGYRGKIEFAFGESSSGVTLGFRERVSPFTPYAGRVMPVTECSVFGPAAVPVLNVLRDVIRTSGLKPYDPVRKRGVLKELVLRQGRATGDLMVILDVAGKARIPEPSLAGTVRRELPQVKSFYLFVDGRARLLYGEPYIEERLGGLSFRITPASFFQPNPETAALLFERVPGLAGITQEMRVLGLYCGMGPIELFMASCSQEVVGIDSLPANITAARENARLNGVGNCRFEEGTVEGLSKQLIKEAFQAIVVDPPRTGLSREASGFLVEAAAPMVVYISCDPATLARDLKVLCAGGYRTAIVAPFDFFPHAAHVETLVVLERQGSRKTRYRQ